MVPTGSRFSIAEVLWDIHDTDRTGDRAGLDYPLFLTLRLLAEPKGGEDYPYFVTLLEAYDADASISAVTPSRASLPAARISIPIREN